VIGDGDRLRLRLQLPFPFVLPVLRSLCVSVFLSLFACGDPFQCTAIVRADLR